VIGAEVATPCPVAREVERASTVETRRVSLVLISMQMRPFYMLAFGETNFERRKVEGARLTRGGPLSHEMLYSTLLHLNTRTP